MRKIAFLFVAFLALCLSSYLLVAIIPLLDGGDSHELTVKSVLLAILLGYTWLQARACFVVRRRLLWVAFGMNALVLLPLGLVGLLGRLFGGDKIMPRELGICGAVVAICAMGAAVLQGRVLVHGRSL